MTIGGGNAYLVIITFILMAVAGYLVIGEFVRSSKIVKD